MKPAYLVFITLCVYLLAKPFNLLAQQADSLQTIELVAINPHLHEDQVQMLHKRYPVLSPQEVEFALSIRSGINDHELAATSRTTTRKIEEQRGTLRKKMNLKPGEKLVDEINKALK